MNWMKGLWTWVDARLPVQRAWDTHMGKYYAPKNFNFWYFFGVLSILVLVNQLITGIWLTMNYTPSAEEAFASVEYIMRDVDYGWILRYMHSTGASAFFVVVYLHMFRGLMYGSYKAPRELVWIFGMTIYLVLMAEAFMGYVLPWGQMSYWGAQVIVSLVGAIPVVGESLVEWIRGDYLISGITLNRFFALHVVALPIVLLGLVVLHLLALHEVGSNNPDGIEIKKNKDENGIPKDGVAFHPFYTVHDLVGVSVFLFVFCFVMFFMPEMGGFFLEYANFEEANNLKTPAHIAPVWYFTPFYAILRAINFPIGPLDAKFLGLVAMGAAIAILFVLPWLDRSPVKSMRYKGNFSRIALIVFAAAFVILGYLGVKSPTPGRTYLAQACTFLYFAYFIGMPFWTRREKTLPEPKRVQMKGLPLHLVLGGFALFVFLVVVPIKAVGAEGSFACGAVPCDTMEPDLENKASLQRGAKYFVNYCMGCHSAKFSRYQRVADDLDIPHDLMMDNMVFGADDKRVGDLMNNAMSADLGKQWFGAAPPDLTLVARARSPEWLYTYLRNFYKDEERPLGVNNRVFANVGMPHVMMELQGLLECGAGPKLDSHGHTERDDLGNPVIEEHCGALVEGETKGSMTGEEFDRAMFDLVNFLEYVAEPSQLDRKRIGVFVLLFICVLFIFTYLLNREYWKGIH
ncbi:cytochrome b N-terminal domain-containing protein [Gilvimarinus agarilyticus]|uniref:ubiquinol-cytochrome c reductase n=1 Tax=Gilvimarinus sp. 2_MG-2023 TaxID=3062666 RepID=UPI001C09B193|nr:cytochrome b N-terminal domain-containing protein [Gilvimarinus sp. 2_MG-2023]MBU2887634.1 cytochrome b N-terminal domain-containing protein [Gilvimarinus agarilyticus]MDO6572285.1 cytochrome b N-terminal domain-containing protein [Gilvimarinus sp. 2_MG-2023]